MRIGELADRTGISTKAIRYYEDIGVLPEPSRSSNGYRTYEEDQVRRLGFIRDAQVAGLSLTEIQLILELRDEGEPTCDHTIGLLQAHRDDVDRQLRELARTRDHLQDMIDNARTLDPAECNDPNRCQTIVHQN